MSTKTTKQIKVLLVEDNPGDAVLIEETLNQGAGSQFLLEFTNRLDKAANRLSEGGIDIVLLDLSLPDSLGLNTFTKLHANAPRVPIIILSGHDDEVLAVNAVQEGAFDYLIKGQIDREKLVGSIFSALDKDNL